MRQQQTTPGTALFTTLQAAMLASLLLLGACGTQPGQAPDPGADQTGDQPATSIDSHTDADGYSDALPASAYSDIFERSEAHLAALNWVSARTALQALPATLNNNDRARRDYLLARAAWLRGNADEARRLLKADSQAVIAPGLKTRQVNFQRHMESMQRNYLKSAQLGSQLLSDYPDYAGSGALRRSIWRDLEHLSAADLNTAVVSDDPNWTGWQQLAIINARTADPIALRSALGQWQRNNPGHPAAEHLPGGLGILMTQAPANHKAALLLPLSGPLAPAARAVRDGFLAAWYSAEGTDSSEVLLLDTAAFPSAVEAYQEAVRQGVSIVVGPLSKAGVSELGQHPDRPVPVLALNRVDQHLPASSTALVQLSLAPEDDLRSLAQLAFGQEARRILVLRPAGDWGDRVFTDLKQQWQALGGHVVSTATYDRPEDYSATIARMFDLQASAERARKLRSMLATDLEYTARRRQDFDAIFLLSETPVAARSLKPLLAFHYAGDVPVYATSTIYPGIPNNRDRDLDDIRLVDLPWLLGSDPALRVAIAAGDTGSDSYPRLNALGADAYLIQQRFRQLQAGPDALFRGDTGLLSMDPGLRILREPQPATFDRGTLKAL